MSLKKRAVSGVIIAGSLVMMCATADAADTVMGEKVMQTAETDAKLATDGTAGVVVLLNQVKTDALSSLDEAVLSRHRPIWLLPQRIVRCGTTRQQKRLF